MKKKLVASKCVLAGIYTPFASSSLTPFHVPAPLFALVPVRAHRGTARPLVLQLGPPEDGHRVLVSDVQRDDASSSASESRPSPRGIHWRQLHGTGRGEHPHAVAATGGRDHAHGLCARSEARRRALPPEPWRPLASEQEGTHGGVPGRDDPPSERPMRSHQRDPGATEPWQRGLPRGTTQEDAIAATGPILRLPSPGHVRRLHARPRATREGHVGPRLRHLWAALQSSAARALRDASSGASSSRTWHRAPTPCGTWIPSRSTLPPRTGPGTRRRPIRARASPRNATTGAEASWRRCPRCVPECTIGSSCTRPFGRTLSCTSA